MKNTVRVERAIMEITQAELADMIHVSRQTISAIELGRYDLSTSLALKMASIFDKAVNDIFTLEETDWACE